MRPFDVRIRLLWLLGTLVFIVGSTNAADSSAQIKVNSPVSPAESLKHLNVAPGLRIDLVAAEPQVVDPVAIAFDEDGRMWVVEMTDYPNGPKPGEAAKSRVRVLEDRDGDGSFETARTFVDELLFATGLQLWKGGVFVTLAGKVVYFRDSTGDGKADIRETWFTGFAQENQQLRANHPTLGPDNRIYIANGLRDGTVVGRPSADGSPATPVSISGRDFRFDPVTAHYDTVTGRGQFGLTFDDFGNRFVCTNRNATKHIVLKRRYIDRNPLQAVPAATYDVCPAGPEAVVFPLSRNWTHYSDHLGQITAACGVLVFRGGALPTEFAGNVFICEPPGNLIHRRILKPNGATFSSKRAREGVEFLASPDDWFRPVNLTIGPDGALYVVDMYRAVVEHPHWLPEHLNEQLPLNAGNDRGRIYRIVSASDSDERTCRSGLYPVPGRLKTCPTSALAQLFEHPNSWWRETAARLIYERQDKDARQDLHKMLRCGKTATSRVHAMWALDGLGQLTVKDVQAAVADINPRVRELAVQLSEPWVDESTTLRRSVIQLAADADARLRFQVALSLGQAKPDGEITDALMKIATHTDTDSWTRSAVLSSIGENSSQVLLEILASTDADKREATLAELNVLGDLAHLVGARRKDVEIRKTIESLVSRKNDSKSRKLELAVLTELARGIAWRGGSLAIVIDAIIGQSDRVATNLRRLLEDVANSAKDEQQNAAVRRQCIELLRYVGFKHAGDALITIVQSQKPQELRLLAINSLSAYDAAQIGRVLLLDFQSQTPAVRSAVLDAMLSDAGRIRLLLSEFANKRIAVSELSPTAVKRLVEHQNAEIREKARRLLADAIPANRQKVLADYKPAISMKGDMARGRLVFEKNCSECHRLRETGFKVGPYIGDFPLKPNVRKNPAVILESILNPNRAIDANYVSYTIVTASGRIHTGIISQETGGSVTLKQPKGKTITVLRSDIDAIRSNRVSLMPEGFEKNISVEQMADLIAYLKDWRFLDGLVPLGETAVEELRR